MQIVRVPATHPDALRLIEEVQQIYIGIYGGRDESPLEAEQFEPPLGAFFVGYVDDLPVASGGWRMRPDVAADLGLTNPAEIKRMYVAPTHQRCGLGRKMLVHVEATALAEGADAMVLETGSPQLSAIELYTAAGYTPVAPFGHYRCAPEVRCFARAL